MSDIAIDIDDGAVVLEDNVSVQIDRSISYLDNGSVNTSETLLELEGNVVAGTPGAVWDTVVELADEVNRVGPKRVQITVDDVAKFDFSPADCINSPVVLRFRTQPAPGAGQGHWRWTMSIYVKQLGGQVEEGADQPPGLYEFHSSIAVRKVNNVIIRKTWKARAKAADVGAAYAAVAGFGPGSANGIVEELDKLFEDAEATGVWVWERKKAYLVEEEVEILGGGDIYIEDPRVGATGNAAPDPNLVKARRKAQVVTVRGTLYAATPVLAQPAAHFSESATMFRQRGLERRYFPVLHDVEDGTYRLRFEEIYIATGGVPGDPNHGDHAELTKKPVPGAGAEGL